MFFSKRRGLSPVKFETQRETIDNDLRYGFIQDGIRHALLDASNISSSDAKYMLVSCSAFINYVLGKMSEK